MASGSLGVRSPVRGRISEVRQDARTMGRLRLVGAGGMAGHVQFGARTGGAVVILGAILLVIAIFLSGSVGTLLRLFPPSILGVILFLTGAQLALGSCDISKDKGERFVAVVTAALAVWNVGIAFVVGMVAHALNKRGWLRV